MPTCVAVVEDVHEYPTLAGWVRERHGNPNLTGVFVTIYLLQNCICKQVALTLNPEVVDTEEKRGVLDVRAWMKHTLDLLDDFSDESWI